MNERSPVVDFAFIAIEIYLRGVWLDSQKNNNKDNCLVLVFSAPAKRSLLAGSARYSRITP